MNVIEVSHVTKDYGHHRGVFDISFTVQKGEVLGFLGPNGSGKTTTIRQLMGFIQPDDGDVKILGRNCFKEAALVQKDLGYLPGEIALMDDMTGRQFIDLMAELKGLKDMQKAQALIDFLELDDTVKIKRMSKGMKQKVGLVIAFMQDAPILILDEPTSGLDPLMQNKFVALIQKAKKEGKTILMSSHIFEEIELTCDRMMMIKEGRIIADQSMQEIKDNRHRKCIVTFKDIAWAAAFAKEMVEAKQDGKKVTFYWHQDINVLIETLSHYELADFIMTALSLEELFIQYYGGADNDQSTDF